MKTVYLFLLIALVTVGCKKSTDGQPVGSITLTGLLKVQVATTYQYGTHTLTTTNNKLYALRSGSIDLDKYVGKNVTISANKIYGYSASVAGPDFLEVVSVE